MLGTRTKQVFSYGKRGHRIVNVSEDRDLDTTRAPNPKPLPLVARATKTKRVSPAKHSPKIASKKRARVRQIQDDDSPPRSKPTSKAARPKQPPACTPVPTPARRPLSAFHPNMPHSPAVHGSAKPNPRPRAPSGMRKPFSPFVDVDIIVLDGAGRRVSQERRVSRTDVQINSARTKDASDSSMEVVKPGKRPATRKKAIVISSDESGSESDDTEVDVLPSLKLAARGPPKHKPRRLQVEVVVPSLASLHIKKPPPPVQVTPPPSPPLEPLQPYASYDLPVHKPRQLTPIRRRGVGSHSLFPHRASPPSPSTPTDFDFDLSLDLAGLNISSPSQPDLAAPAPPEYLVPLLTECGQAAPHEFSAFIETFPFDPIVSGGGRAPVFQKIGEASYSEVFGIGEVVLKVIPLRDELCAGTDAEGPFPSEARDVLKELIVTRAMGETCAGGGFVRLLRGYVVRGRYPELLLGLWDEYAARKGSEGIRPDTFGVSQTYAIIVLPNGGPDLEAYTFAAAGKTGWRQASSLFWQVARALAQAEELVAFEHRDLHWGQILVKNTASKGKASGDVPMDDDVHGVRATIIDLGLARMDARGGGGVHWTPFDEEIFEGEGDYQFDVYRMMKEWNNDEWEGFRPLTNVMWLHYLAQKLLHGKRLRVPRASSAKATRSTPAKIAVAAGFTERECYECLVEVEGLLAQRIASAVKKPVARKGRRKTAPVVSKEAGGLGSAGQIVEYAIGRGWIS
ncbi:hypothetical protein PLICRDRAFT_97040 [Plicaturopsis crispa FD-325 SS-3]|nr:hypothetical protein PLICRDRAFT_97040 [Plicaturopsis crispa FD-325 SS-3]